MARALVTVPATARKGEVIEVRALISHPMETGYRRGGDGQMQARDLIRRFSCAYNGQPVFGAELFAAISANPYLSFFVTATTTGTLSFLWEGDNGFRQTETASLTVT